MSATPAAAHAQLVATDPSGGETVASAPQRVVLTYSEPVEASFSNVQVFDPGGVRVDARAAQIDGPEIVVPMTDVAIPGTYTVVFRVIGVDGHPVESRFTFILNPPQQAPVPGEPTTSEDGSMQPSEAESAPVEDAAEAEPELTPPASTTPSEDTVAAVPTPDPTPTAAMEGPQGAEGSPGIELQDAGRGTAVGLLASRVLDYLALVAIAAGLVGYLWLFTGDGQGAADRRHVMRRLTAWGGGALSVAAAMVFVFGMSTAAAEPLPAALSSELAGQFAATRFGRFVLVQLTLGLGITALAMGGRGRRGAVITSALGLSAAILPGVWGHAGTTSPVPLAVASDWTHVVSAAAWVGGLAVIVGVIHTSRKDPALGIEPVVRFSRLAGVAIWAVLASGVVTALLHIGELAQLTSTAYGRLVIAKTVLFGIIAGLGWVNRSRAIPRLRAATIHSTSVEGLSALRRFGAAELVVMTLALGVAGGLASSIPAEAEAAARVEFVTMQLTDQATVNLTLDPARPGTNVMHLYVLGENGQPRPVDDARLELTGTDDIDVDLFLAGPGHYTALNQSIPVAGQYLMTVDVDLDGQTSRATATMVIQ
ncbi:copper resistance CopC/CopD family protein [Euzebya tangerina]|uniref:copper resistance CopC/CopD family protein n=1 Tax=Euzebya tangerina TaxID=591198 RepID=UPI000E31D18C|nr:copper resistance protein CopC [Euzebya tangerina]